MARDGHINRKTQDSLRASIKAAEIIEKLQAHILDGVKLTPSQIRAGEILLRKIQPDLTATQLSADAETTLPMLTIVPSDASKAA